MPSVYVGHRFLQRATRPLSSRPPSRCPGLVQIALSFLILDLAAHCLAAVGQGVIKLAVGGVCHPRRPPRKPGLEDYLLLVAAAVLNRDLKVYPIGAPMCQVPAESGEQLQDMVPVLGAETGAQAQSLSQNPRRAAVAIAHWSTLPPARTPGTGSRCRSGQWPPSVATTPAAAPRANGSGSAPGSAAVSRPSRASRSHPAPSCPRPPERGGASAWPWLPCCASGARRPPHRDTPQAR